MNLYIVKFSNTIDVKTIHKNVDLDLDGNRDTQKVISSDESGVMVQAVNGAWAAKLAYEHLGIVYQV